MKEGTVIRHVVLDNEAASALLRRRQHDARRKEVVLAISAANGRRVVPSAVRVETLWQRRTAAAADANRLVPEDFDFDRTGADRMVTLREAVATASVVDAAVALAAEHLGATGEIVEVCTSDVEDMTALAEHVNANVHVKMV